MEILLIAPSPPPYGGMALQARLLERLLRQDGRRVALCASNSAFPAALRPLERVPGLRTGVRSMLLWWNLWKQVRSAQVVHILAASWLYFFLVVAPSVVIGKHFRKRIVLNYRGGEADRFLARFGWAARPIFRWATVTSAPSAFLAEVIRNRLEMQTSIVPNILDLSTFRYHARETLQPRLLVTRHLEKIYDIESVLRAFRLIQEKYPDASLDIAGTGSEAAHLQQLVSEWNLRHVRFHGHVPQASLPALHEKCDIFLNASRVDNFPGALIEASASGLVVISTCAGGIPFLYENRKSALLVEPGDWHGLANGVDEVLSNPALASALSQAAAVLARSCAWEQVRRPLYATYGMALPES